MNLTWSDYKNMKEAFDHAASCYQDKTIVKLLDENKKLVEINNTKFFEDIHKYASALVRIGLQGKHVGLIGENSYEYLITFCACVYTGTVAVLLSRDYNTQEIRQHCELTDTDILIFSKEQEEKVYGLTGDLQLISMNAAEASDKQYPYVSLKDEKEKGLLAITNTTGPEDLSIIIFTSGTTGISKAVMHSNKSLLAGVVDRYFDDDFDSVLLLFPFHHVGGYAVALEAIFADQMICLGVDPKYILRYLEKLQPAFLFAVPALLQIICQKLKNKTQEELGWKLRCISSGGAKGIVNDYRLLVERGIIVNQSYSASELGGRGISSYLDLEDLETLGKAQKMVEAKIIAGELVLGSPSVCMGYYKNPEETAETIKDGCYYTGDLARVDERGYYYLTGRKKNLIILSNGENVSPEEIEGIFYQHSEIKEILVREASDVIGAVIHPDYDECNSEAEKEVVNQKIHEIVDEYNKSALTYKQVHKVEITDVPLEKTATNKIKRF